MSAALYFSIYALVLLSMWAVYLIVKRVGLWSLQQQRMLMRESIETIVDRVGPDARTTNRTDVRAAARIAARVVGALRLRGPLPLASLEMVSGVSPPLLPEVLDTLLAEGIVVVVPANPYRGEAVARFGMPGEITGV